MTDRSSRSGVLLVSVLAVATAAAGCSASDPAPSAAGADAGSLPPASADGASSPPASGDAGGASAAGADGAAASDGAASSGLTWRRANLTNYESYPPPGSPECTQYNGCTWAGQFAALPDKQPESWVAAHDIIAVHSKDFPTYKLKTLRIRQGAHQIDATVYDECADSDCSGCCTANSKQTGFLIDMEKYTVARFGSGDGIVEWACLDCN